MPLNRALIRRIRVGTDRIMFRIKRIGILLSKIPLRASSLKVNEKHMVLED
jgi:hypothetical protein